MTTLYHNPRCSKSRQALQLLKSENEQVTIIEYLKEIPTKSELKDILRMLNITAAVLIRAGEKVWKDTYKSKNLSEDELINAMIENPKLIERPIAIKNGKAIIGRPPERVLDL
jgi:arsenate reductase